MIKVIYSRHFEKIYKKLHNNQQITVDEAIEEISKNPKIGVVKKNDLTGFYVYKFSMLSQLTLLGYYYYEDQMIISVIAVGSHENFYRDIKRN